MLKFTLLFYKEVNFMRTKDEMNWIMDIIQQLTAHYNELAAELPELQIVVDNTRINSELKKILRAA